MYAYYIISTTYTLYVYYATQLAMFELCKLRSFIWQPVLRNLPNAPIYRMKGLLHFDNIQVFGLLISSPFALPQYFSEIIIPSSFNNDFLIFIVILLLKPFWETGSNHNAKTAGLLLTLTLILVSWILNPV